MRVPPLLVLALGQGGWHRCGSRTGGGILMDLLLHWELHLCRHMNEMLDAQWLCCISTMGFLNNAQILNSSMQLRKKDFSVPKGTKHEIFHHLQVCEQPIALIGSLSINI